MEIGESIPDNLEYHNMTEELVETNLEQDSHKRKPTWEHKLLWEAERYGAPKGIHIYRERENPYNSYASLLCYINDKEPSTYEEAT